MARVLLNGPAVTIAPHQNLGGQRSNAIFESRRRAAHALDHLRIECNGKVEIKASIGPFDSSFHFGLSLQDDQGADWPPLHHSGCIYKNIVLTGAILILPG